MLKQIGPNQIEPANRTVEKISNLWFRLLLAVIAGTAVGLVVVPVMLPVLGGTSSGLGPEAYSHITRASAIVAFGLVWVSMLAGLSITSKLGSKGQGMSWRFGLHRYTSLLGLGFALVHALSLLGGGYMTYTLGQLLVPFIAGSYKPQWLGLGQVALYLLAVIALSFYVRNRLGVRTWRLIHGLSFALFLMALVHGLQSGSDSGTWWAAVLYWVSGASVVLGSIYRVLAARTGRSKDSVAPTGLIALGGRAKARPGARVPLAPSLTVGNTMQPVPARVLVRK